MKLADLLEAARRQREVHLHCKDAGGRSADALALATFVQELLSKTPAEPFADATNRGNVRIDFDIEFRFVPPSVACCHAADLLRAAEEAEGKTA